MGFSVGDIDLGLDVNQQSFNKQLNGIAGGAEKSVKSAFSGIGKTIGLVLGGAAVVSFTKSCLDLGSDLNEVQNVVDVTFKQMNGSVNEFAKNAMTQFGLSETVTKKYMGTLGAMSNSMGFTEQQSYQMAKAITGLSGDVASFYNMSSDEAYTKLKSIWTGETETLKEIGVVMTQTALDQYALNNGFGKTTAKMTEQEKVMLRYQYVMSSLSASQGDFARTSGSWANQIRVLGLRFDSLKASLGQGFINLFTPIVQVINSILTKLQSLADGFKTFTEVITGNKASQQTSNAIAAIGAGATDAADNISGMGNATVASAKKAQKALMGFDQVNVLADKSSSTPTSAAASSGGTSSGAAVDDSVVASMSKLQEAMQPTLDAFDRFKKAMEKPIDFAKNGLKSFYEDLLVPIGKWVLGEGIPKLLDSASNLVKDVNWDKLSKSLRNFNKALAPFAIAIGQGLVDFISDLSKALSPVVSVLMDSLADSLNDMADSLNQIDPEKTRKVGESLGYLFISIGYVKTLESAYVTLQRLGSGLKLLAAGIDAIALVDPFAVSILLSNLVFALDEKLTKWVEEELGKFWKHFLVIFSNVGIGAVAGFAFAGPVGAILGGILGGLNALAYELDIGKFWDDFWSNTKKICLSYLGSVFSFDNTKQLFSETIQHFKDAFSGKDIGINLVLGLLEGIESALMLIIEPINDLFWSIVTSVKKLFGIHSPSTVFAEIGSYLIAGLQKGIEDAWNAFITYIKSLPGNIVTGFGDIKTKFTVKGKDILDGIKDGWDNKITAFTSWLAAKPASIASTLGNISSSFKSKGSDILEGIKSGWTTGWSSFKTWLESIPSMIGNAIGDLSSIGKSIVSSLIAGLKSISLPKVSISLGTKTTSILGKDINVPSVDIKWLAQGGYVKANTPQLAVIGDNKHEGEVVAPESKLTQMALEAARLAGGSGGLSEAALYRVMARVFQEYMHIYIGEEDLARHVNRGNQMIDLRNSPVKGGGY